jgi:RimJ/RimL family protein N-acetyltransferase
MHALVLLAHQYGPKDGLSAESVRRIEYLRSLAKSCLDPFVLIMGRGRDRPDDHSISSLLADYYLKYNESSVCLYCDHNSMDTVGDAVYSSILLRNLAKKVTIVTSKSHSFRAQRVFRQIYPTEIEIDCFYPFKTQNALDLNDSESLSLCRFLLDFGDYNSSCSLEEAVNSLKTRHELYGYKRLTILSLDSGTFPLLYKWRTDASTIRNSISQDSFSSYDAHYKWCELAVRSSDELLYIASNEDQPVGYARYTIQPDGIWKLSFLISPNFRGRGYSYRVIKDTFSQALTEGRGIPKILEADIILTNNASRHILTKLGFKITRSSGTVYETLSLQLK